MCRIHDDHAMNVPRTHPPVTYPLIYYKRKAFVFTASAAVGCEPWGDTCRRCLCVWLPTDPDISAAHFSGAGAGLGWISPPGAPPRSPPRLTHSISALTFTEPVSRRRSLEECNCTGSMTMSWSNAFMWIDVYERKIKSSFLFAGRLIVRVPVPGERGCLNTPSGFLVYLFMHLFRKRCENFRPRSLKVRSPGHVKSPHLRKV